MDFIISIALSILSFFLIKHARNKNEPDTDTDNSGSKFDFIGLILLVITLLSVNVMVTQASDGLLSPVILSLFGIFLIAGIFFVLREFKTENPLVDFSLFKNKGYSGATFKLHAKWSSRWYAYRSKYILPKSFRFHFITSRFNLYHLFSSSACNDSCSENYYKIRC